MGSADRGPVATFIMSLIYLGFYAHMGVLTRVYLDRFVTLGCSATSWGPCWVSYNWPGGLYGLYTSVLHNSLLLLGLRTGYCGCLTTFASWMLGLVTTAVPYDRYPDMIFGQLVGLQTSLFCVILGQHVAMVLHRHWHGQRFSAYPKAAIQEVESVIEGLEQMDRQGYEQSIQQRMSEYTITTAASTRSMPTGPSGVVLPHAASGEEPRSNPSVVVVMHTHQNKHGVDQSVDQNGDQSVDQNVDQSVDQHAPSHVDTATHPPHSPNDHKQPPVVASHHPPPITTLSPKPSAAASSSPFESVKVNAPPLLPHALRASTWGVCQTKTDLVHVVLWIAALLTFLLLLILYDRGSQVHKDTKTWFFAIVVAPLGCYGRWQLGRLNFQGTGFRKYFPTGTFAANMLGTAITFGLQCFAARKTLSYWESVVVVGMQTGFCGALTTVSTWAVEVLGGARLIRDGIFIGYIYAFVTLLGGMLLGLTIYGWTVWAY